VGADGVVATSESATGTALILVDARGRNQIAVAPGANRQLLPAHVVSRSRDFEWARIVMCQLEVPRETTVAALREARRHGTTTILTPAPIPDEPLDFWRLVDYLTPNAGEAERLTGTAVRDRESAEAAARALLARGVGVVIVTLGEAGALACEADR